MANYANLKAAINAVIKANGNEEITGDILNSVLTAIVTNLGANYQFKGLATVYTYPSDPDQNIFYFATEAGTYTNFGGKEVPAGLNLLVWNGVWTLITLFEVDDAPTENSENYVVSGGVYAAIETAVQGIMNLIPASASPQNKLVDNNDLASRLSQKQDNLTFDPSPTEGSNNPAKSGGIYTAIKNVSDALTAEITRAQGAEGANAADIDGIEAKIPAQASSSNQLADKDFVNSSVATNTANYISDNGQPFQSLAALQAYSGALTNNDYAFVVGTDAVGNTQYTRYKYNSTNETWALEYVLNNSSFTAAQWATISSGITSGDKERLDALPTRAQLDAMLAAKQDTLTFDDVPVENSTNPVKSGGVYSKLATINHNINVMKSDIKALELENIKNHINYIYIDQNITDPATRVTGDINGTVIQWIRSNSHRYLGKYTATGTMTLCQLSDSDTTKFDEDDSAATLNGTQGDVYMQHPTFYTDAEEVSDKVWKIGFAVYQVDANWKEWNENDIIGVYEAAVTSEYNGTTAYGADNGVGYMRSISGVASQGNVSQENFKTKARNRGTGFTAVKWQHQNIMAFLYYAQYGNTNCQAQCGSGTNSYTKSTGQTDSLGMTDTTSSNGNSMSINFFGLENWWGNKNEFVDNVVVNRGEWNITEDDGTVRQVTGQATYNSVVYPAAFTIGKYLDVIPLPTQSGGSDSTGYCDAVYMSQGGNLVVTRSYNKSDAQCGVAYADSFSDPWFIMDIFGSRLAFKGTIVKASKADFLAATAIG